MPLRCLLLVTKTSYRTDAFLAAARALGVEVIVGSDRCHQLAELWPDEFFKGAFDGSVPVDLRDPEEGAAAIVRAARERPFDAIVPTDDATAVVAAMAAARLGLSGNDPDSVYAARNKAVMRRRLRAAGVPAPDARTFSFEALPADVIAGVRALGGYPVVVKPLLLSGSRGVIRVDDDAQLGEAWRRIVGVLRSRGEFEDDLDPDWRRLLVEPFVAGDEVALEGILRAGALRTLALYDKPDPLDGPYFEETIYVTPSRKPAAAQRAIEDVTARAAAALGLVEGPIHAELRVNDLGPHVIEVAARSIGGLCARTLRYTLGGGDSGHALEELVLRRALGLGDDALADDSRAAGVMMLPVPGAGVLQEVQGIRAAKDVPLVEDIVITAKIGERLVPWPEGSSYPGFIFARGDDPAAVEHALREAYRHLKFTIAKSL